MDDKNSTICDGISVKLLKIAFSGIFETLTFIITLRIQNNIFLTIFKRAKVILLPKTKTISFDLNDYRLTSVLPVFTKPLEKHIHKQLTDVFGSSPSLPFLSARLLTWTFLSDCAYPFNWYLAFCFQQSLYTGCCSLDLCKAFDPVNHNILLKKLLAYNLSTESITFLGSYLHGQLQWVLVNGHTPIKSLSRVEFLKGRS